MFSTKKPVFFLIILAMLLAACAPAAAGSDSMMDDKPTEVMMEQGDSMMAEKTATSDDMIKEEEMMAGATATSEAMMKEDEMMAKTATAEARMHEDEMMSATATPEAMMETPAFFSASLADVATGQSFTIDDLKGKVILVETMAQWCPKCLEQQKQVLELLQTLGERDNFVILGLDIDPNEDAASLKTYIESNGFSWRYAVPPAEVSNEIAKLYGDQFLNPTSTPMFIIDRHGEVHLLSFGIKSAQDLLTALRPFLDEGM